MSIIFFDIDGTIANPDGTSILLPISGDGTQVEQVKLRVDYDAADGEAFAANFDISGLTTSGVQVAQTTLALDGTLQGNLGSVGQFLGDMSFVAEGLTLTDAATGEAIGDRITGKAELNYIEGQPFRVSGLELVGTDYGLTGMAVLNGRDFCISDDIRELFVPCLAHRISVGTGNPSILGTSGKVN